MFIQSTMMRLFVLSICYLFVFAVDDLITDNGGFGTKILFEGVVTGEVTDNSVFWPVSLAGFRYFDVDSSIIRVIFFCIITLI